MSNSDLPGRPDQLVPAGAAAVQIFTLGELAVAVDGVAVAVGPRKQRALLGLLLCRPGAEVPSGELIDALWGFSAPPSAANNLRTYVHGLRQVLRGDLITGNGRPGYRLRTDLLWTDTQQFLAHREEAERALERGDPVAARVALQAAVALRRGPAFGDIRGLTAVEEEAGRWEERWLLAVEQRVELDLDRGQAAELVGELTALVGQHAYRERLVAFLMLALYRSGRQTEALAVYRRTASTLAQELAVEPGAGLTELHRAMLCQDPGLEDRIEVQLSAGLHAAPNPPAAAMLAAPHHLPLDIPDFTGRREPIEAMREQLTAGRAVIVVSGEAGVGKTSLVVHLAHRLVELFPDGQLFVALAGSGSRPATAQEVLSRILVLLGVDRTAIPPEVTLRTELFRAVLAHRRVLLVLDNAADVAQVRALLPGGTGSALLVTIRRALAGLEPAYHLVLPELSGVESIELLANIAGTARVAAEPDAATRIAQLCDRLPLAIRIAGARLAAKPHWALRELVERLTDEHRRLDELQIGDLAVRASLSLTYQVLQPGTRQLFRVLGQLTGSDFPAWVAATLVGAPVTEVTEGLEQLVDWHLLDVAQRDAAGRQRYRMHDLLAVFARELQRDAVEDGERHTAMGQALGAWLTVFDGMEARLVREARSYDRHRPTPSYPLGWLPPQRAAVSGATAETTAETSTLIIETGWAVTATLVGMSFELWSQWDNWRMTRAVALYSGRRAGDRLIAQTWEIKPGQERPWSAAVTTLEQGVRSFHDLEELTWHAVSLLSLGNLYRAGARLDESGQTLHACVERFRALGHPDWTGAALLSLGSLGVVDGRLAEAVTSLRDCLDIFADRGDRLWQGYARRALGYAYQQHGRFAEAVVELEAALPVFREHEDSMWEAHTSLTLGLARLGLHQFDHAVDELERSVATFRYYGDPRSEALALRALARAEIGRNRVDAAETHLRASLAVFTALENTIGTPLALWDLGTMYQRSGRSAEADTYLVPARQIFAELKLTELPSLAR
jgi:DNA-binding SARP family transcriptional activator/tetratricopeptide (TPR) repeat protein